MGMPTLSVLIVVASVETMVVRGVICPLAPVVIGGVGEATGGVQRVVVCSAGLPVSVSSLEKRDQKPQAVDGTAEVSPAESTKPVQTEMLDELEVTVRVSVACRMSALVVIMILGCACDEPAWQ